MILTIPEQLRPVLQFIRISEREIQHILENPDKLDRWPIPRDAPSKYANYEFVFHATKWSGDSVILTLGAGSSREWHLLGCWVLKDNMPNGEKISPEMSPIEIGVVFHLNFPPEASLFQPIAKPAYMDWYIKQDFQNTISLDIPAIRAISSPKIEALGRKARSRSHVRTLEAKCDEFRKLLDATHTEEPLHQWLAEDDNLIFFGADAERVWSKVQVGEFYTDFIVKRTSLPYLLVEIETTAKIFTKKGEPCAQFNHACLQVKDWQRRIRTHPSYFREFIAEDLYEPEGLVVMGRTQDIDDKLKEARWRDLQREVNPRSMTFDDLIARVRNVVRMLRDIGNS